MSCCGDGSIVVDARIPGGGGDASLFEGTFETVGAVGVAVDLADVTAIGAFVVVAAAHLSCVRTDAGSEGQRVASWSVTAFLVTNNAVDGVFAFPNPLEFATGYVAGVGVGPPAPAAGSLAFVAGTTVQLAALGVAGETLQWYYRGSLTVARGAVRLIG